MKPAEVVAHHLDAVGTVEARSASRNVAGSCAMTAPASGGVAGALLRRFSFDSEAGRFALWMKSPSQGYPAETFGLEGGKPDVYLQLEETFGEFKTVKGMTLPSSWTLRYETQAKVTQYWKYELAAETLERQ